MRMIKEVLRLYHSGGLSQKQISKALGCSRGAVAEYLHRAQAAGFSWPLPDELDDAQIERRLFPPKIQSQKRPQPDFAYVHAELKKKGVTLIQLWAEYREEHPDGYGQTQFCDLYGRFEKSLNQKTLRFRTKRNFQCELTRRMCYVVKDSAFHGRGNTLDC